MALEFSLVMVTISTALLVVQSLILIRIAKRLIVLGDALSAILKDNSTTGESS
jgi:hypothetical protein